jgi:hypothetical protein
VQLDHESNVCMILRSDGRIQNSWLTNGWIEDPAPGIPFLKVSCGFSLRTALCADGQVISWRSSSNRVRFPVPPLPPGVVYVDIANGYWHSVGRRSDGQVVAWTNSGDTGPLRVPPLAPGESYVQIDACGNESSARVGPTRTYVSFADGCGGSRPPARLVPRDTPFVGGTQEVRIFDLPQHCAFMVFGWNRIMPIALGPLGMPQCFQHISADAAVFVVGQDHFARYELPIPNMVGLLGLRFYNQAVVLDPPANPLGVVMSAAAEAVIGRR